MCSIVLGKRGRETSSLVRARALLLTHLPIIQRIVNGISINGGQAWRRNRRALELDWRVLINLSTLAKPRLRASGLEKMRFLLRADLARIHFDPDEKWSRETCFVVRDKSWLNVAEKNCAQQTRWFLTRQVLGGAWIFARKAVKNKCKNADRDFHKEEANIHIVASRIAWCDSKMRAEEVDDIPILQLRWRYKSTCRAIV